MRKCRKCNNSLVNETKTCEICTLKRISYEHLGTSTRWKELYEILKEQNHCCVYGGIRIYLGTDASLDHIIAKNNGGTNDIENLQWIHIWLNKMKHTLGEEEFLKKLYQFVDRVAAFRHIPNQTEQFCLN